MAKVLRLSVRRSMKIFFMGGVLGYWLLAFERNLRKRIGW
jgi:hypothetical protein